MSNTILRNGHRTLIEIVGLTARFEEVSLNPFGVEADDSVEQTNMRTNNWRGFLGGALLTATEMSVKVHYAPGAIEQLVPILRTNRAIRVIFPDGANVLVYCIVQSFVPDEHTTNEKPTATLTLRPSNLTTSNPPAEIGPVYATGTTTTVAP
jgi:hypothetical protein